MWERSVRTYSGQLHLWPIRWRSKNYSSMSGKLRLRVFLELSTHHRLLHVSPPASVSSQSAVSSLARLMPWEVRDRRIWIGGSSRGLSAARTLLLVVVVCWRLRNSGLAYTALSSIKQVVTLSHNFIVHISPTEGHGAMENQLVSSDKRNKEHTEGVYSWSGKCGAHA